MAGHLLRHAVGNEKAMPLLAIFKVTLATLTLALLCSCSKAIQIEDGYCGVSVKYGNPMAGVIGPGSIQKPALGIVVKFQQSKIIDIKLKEDKPIRVNVRVLDPVQYYKLSLGSYEVIADYYERRIKNRSREDAISMVLKDLNTPGTGIQVTIAQNAPENTF